jgi:hypothetical protein
VLAADLTEPLVGALATVLVAVIGGLVTLYAPEFKRSLDQGREAKELEARYRRSLFTAANDLQSRLYNIAELEFLRGFWNEDRFYAETSTLWLIGQYLGWVEIFRREAGLVLSGVSRGNELLRLIDEIGAIFATDEYGRALRVFRSHQSAIAEVMISEEGRGTPRVKCLGYATFVKRLKEEDFARWFSNVRDDLGSMADMSSSRPNGMAGDKRVVMLQHALMDLMAFLDPEGVTGKKLARATVSDPGSTPTA